MNYKFFFFTLILCLCALAVTAYRSVATPAVPPTQTLPPTPAPSTTAVPPPAIESTALLTLAPFTITFPAPWSVLRPERRGWATEVRRLQQTKPELARDLDTIGAMVDRETAIVLAWQPTTTTQISLVAAVTPAEDLTLSTYLTTLTDELTTAGVASKPHITLQSAGIRYDLHQEGIPVAVLQYVTTEEPDAAIPLITHYQAILLDRTATHLLILTFVVRDAQPETTLAIVDTIVATIQQN